MLSAAFSTVDYVVFGLFILISFLIGFYHSFKHSSNNEEFLMGGRSIGIIPMAISMVASFNSAYMILGKNCSSLAFQYHKDTDLFAIISSP